MANGEPDWSFIVLTGAVATAAMVALVVLTRFTYMRLMVTVVAT